MVWNFLRDGGRSWFEGRVGRQIWLFVGLVDCYDCIFGIAVTGWGGGAAMMGL